VNDILMMVLTQGTAVRWQGNGDLTPFNSMG
jgi:hypothetical protein